jgi:hypothetical protein
MNAMSARVQFNGKKMRSVDDLRREVAEMLRFWEQVWNEAEEMLAWLNPAAAALGVERDEDGLAIILPEPAEADANDLIEIRGPAQASDQARGSDSSASDDEQKSEPAVPSGRALDTRGMDAFERQRAVELGRLPAKERERLLLEHMRKHHLNEAVDGPQLRDEIGMASSDFGNAIRALRDRGEVEDAGYVRRPDGGKTQAKMWKLAAPESEPPRRGPTPEANRVRRETGNLKDVREVESNGAGTVEGRILARLQLHPSLPDDLTDWLEVPAQEVGAALTKLLDEGEIEQRTGGLYHAV